MNITNYLVATIFLIALLKIYLSLGLNASFRDSQRTTLFEYCFLYNNQEAGRLFLLNQSSVFKKASSPSPFGNLIDMLLSGCSFLTPLSFIEVFLQKNIDMKCLVIHKDMSQLVKFTDLKDKLICEDGTNLINQISYDPYYSGSEYTIEIYESIKYYFQLKLFQKNCLKGCFSIQNVDFLKNRGVDFSINAADGGGNSNENHVAVFNTLL